MTLEEPLHQVETARAQLSQAARRATAWTDRQRQDFDRDRLKPLFDAGERLQQALQRADEQCARADRLV